MVNWLRNFWYHDTIDEMQRKMLKRILSNRFRPRKVWYTGCWSYEPLDQFAASTR